MPRIFSSLEGSTNAGFVDFVNGAAAVPATATSAIAYFTGADYTVDYSKNALTAMDTMTRAQIDGISSYLGVALVPADTKAEVIRKIETAVSVLKRITLTVTSVKTATDHESTITVVTDKANAANIHKYKAAAVAPTLLYGDCPDSTWITFTSGTVIKPLTTGEYIAVVECNAAGDFVLGYGTKVIAATAGE